MILGIWSTCLFDYGFNYFSAICARYCLDLLSDSFFPTMMDGELVIELSQGRLEV